MEHDFWHQKWATNKIGFHLTDVNPVLNQFWSHLNPKREESVFVPLCGKSMDLDWLAERHDLVVGVELSKIAIRAYFSERLYTPTVIRLSGQHERYEFDELQLYVGDYFTAPIAPVDLIYDRAALVALPKILRQEYVSILLSRLNQGGRVLLVTLDFPQHEKAGPPFSVLETEVRSLFDGLKVTRLQRDDENKNQPKSNNGLSRFAEEVWLIEAR